MTVSFMERLPNIKLLSMGYDSICESVFVQCGKCWHLCTPGDLSGVLFREKKDYVFGMNLVALCVGEFWGDVQLYTFQIMSNHLHFVMSGKEDKVLAFFDEFRRRLRKYLALKGNVSDVAGFTCTLFPIMDLGYMRNVIAYVNRNGYLIDTGSTPFSYPWGANRYFFTRLALQEQHVLLEKLPVRIKRKMFHTHSNNFPKHYCLTGEFVSPYCYTVISTAECFFRNAHHYFNLVSRRVESFTRIAKELGDMITYTDDELFTAVCALSAQRYGIAPKILDRDQKIEVAKELHFSYNASNKQIKRVLRLDGPVVEELFPGAARRERGTK